MIENLSVIVLLGISVGFVGSFLGIGGGAIIVPVLIFLFPDTPLKAIVGISLGTIMINSVLNATSFYTKYGSAPWMSSKKFILGTIPGAILGSVLLFYIPEESVKILFAFFLLMQAFKLTYKAYRKETHSKVKELSYSLIGFLGGIISSLTGLGGGAVFVPLIKSSTNINTKYISVVSNHIMILATFIGLLPFWTLTEKTMLPFMQFEIGIINFFIILVLVLSSFISRPIGVRFNDKISEQKKSMTLAIVFLVLAIKILVNANF